MTNETPGSERRPGLGALIGVSATTALLVWLVMTSGDRGATPNEVTALRHDVEALAREVAALRAEHRTLASLHTIGEPMARNIEAARSGAAAPLSSGALAAKPLEESQDSGERARRIGDDSIARALERAAAVPAFEPAPAAPPMASDFAPPTDEGADAKAVAATAAEELKRADTEAVIAAFNRLLADAGLDGWTMITAEVCAEDHALGMVVLAQRTPQGTAIGSLSAERLKLERDPITGVAGILLTGARGLESGVEIAYENSSTRLDIPGILPLELLAPRLREILGVGLTGEPTKAFSSGDQIVAAINKVLALEATVGMRIRSVDKVEERKLKKAVIDLVFDEHGTATQTVLADEAWFELDLAGRYGELHCEGGEMLEKGEKRPLFRGRLRVPLREIKPEQWRGVPAARLTEGS